MNKCFCHTQLISSKFDVSILRKIMKNLLSAYLTTINDSSPLGLFEIYLNQNIWLVMGNFKRVR